MSLVAYALTTVADIEEALEITAGTKTSLITNLINRATDLIESYCDRRFISTAYTNEVYDGMGAHTIVLKQFPVTAISSLQYRNAYFPEFTSNWTTIDSSYYDYKSSGIVYYTMKFSNSVLHYRISYTAGYTTIPNDLAQACIELVSYFMAQTKDKGMQSERLGDYSYTRAQTTLKNAGILEIVDSYKRDAL